MSFFKNLFSSPSSSDKNFLSNVKVSIDIEDDEIKIKYMNSLERLGAEVHPEYIFGDTHIIWQNGSEQKRQLSVVGVNVVTPEWVDECIRRQESKQARKKACLRRNTTRGAWFWHSHVSH